MRKATIASIVLALLVAANAAAATNKVPIMKRKGGRKSALNELLKDRKKREPGDCAVITCIAEGETCSDEDESKVCNDLMDCINGKCGVYTEGGPCSDSSNCYNEYVGDDDLYCNDTENKCHKQKGEGGACTYGGYECKNDFFCDAKDSETPGVCVKEPTKAGDKCNGYTSCPGNLRCYNYVCTEPPTTVGAECDPDELPCVGSNLFCNSADNKCAVLPSEGDACINGECAAGFYCNSDDTCNATRGLGEECTENSMCAEGLYCSYNDWKCTKIPVTGEKCSSNYPYCADYNYCDSATNKCVQYPGAGEECYDDNHCGPELMCASDNLINKRMCRSTDGKEGSYCNDDTPCNEGLHCDFNRDMCVDGCVYDEDCNQKQIPS